MRACPAQLGNMCTTYVNTYSSQLCRNPGNNPGSGWIAIQAIFSSTHALALARDEAENLRVKKNHCSVNWHFKEAHIFHSVEIIDHLQDLWLLLDAWASALMLSRNLFQALPMEWRRTGSRSMLTQRAYFFGYFFTHITVGFLFSLDRPPTPHSPTHSPAHSALPHSLSHSHHSS